MTTDLMRLRPLIEIMAAERTKDRPDLFQDCVQEGLIAAWQASEHHPGKTPVYYQIAARNGVLDLLRGRSAFGAPSHQGRQQVEASQPLEHEVDGVTVTVDLEDPRASDAFTAVEYADAVRDAVASLPQEDAALVHGRYWEDRGFRDLARAAGRSERSLQHQWTNRIRPVLAERLNRVVTA